MLVQSRLAGDLGRTPERLARFHRFDVDLGNVVDVSQGEQDLAMLDWIGSGEEFDSLQRLLVVAKRRLPGVLRRRALGSLD